MQIILGRGIFINNPLANNTQWYGCFFDEMGRLQLKLCNRGVVTAEVLVMDRIWSNNYEQKDTFQVRMQ